MMKRRIELEKKEKCLGKLEHHGEFNPDEDQSGCINLYQGADVFFEEEVENVTTPGTKEVNMLFFILFKLLTYTKYRMDNGSLKRKEMF